MFNETSFNPGAVGSKEYISIHLNGRFQWAGFEGAPATQMLNIHGNVGKNIGVGGSIFNDVTGPSRRTGFNIMGAYNLRLSKNNEHHLGMGLGVSLTQHVLDRDKLKTFLPDDPAIAENLNNRLVPDVNLGFYYTYLDKGFAGFSIRNIVQAKRDLFNFDEKVINPMVRNYYFYGGYNFALPKNWTLKPVAMVRMIDALAVSFDISLIASWNNTVWFGTSYRYQDAVAIMAGAQFSIFKFGYSYDVTLSDVRNYSGGTHEVFLELQIFTKKTAGAGKIPWLKRNRVFSPVI
jgi:type IX secretion system PorP/SprF family membrane protein